MEPGSPVCRAQAINQGGRQMQDVFPDGSVMEPWFSQVEEPGPEKLGKPYVITDYGILEDGRVHTQELQNLIDRISAAGGGVLVVPPGIFLTGTVFMKQGVHLWLQRDAVLKGSDDISDYPVMETRIEGETCPYFPGLIQGEHLKGLRIFGEGTLDGNGLRSWKAFWLRRTWNPACTNKDEQRTRLVFLHDCEDVVISGITMQNAQFWTNHLYRCHHVRYLNCRILSPAKPVRAPSTDAIDLDVCSDIHIKGCYMEVNDDAVVLKGGKGPWADQDGHNGPNERILVEDCTFGFCHACLTCGSESIHDRNVLMRRIRILGADKLLWLKMRPDTPQLYEWIRLEEIQGQTAHFLYIHPWTQFYDLKDRLDPPRSEARFISFERCHVTCDIFLDVETDRLYDLRDFSFRDLEIATSNPGMQVELLGSADQVAVGQMSL